MEQQDTQHLHSGGNSLCQVFHQGLLVLKSVQHSTITRKLHLTGRSDQKYVTFDMVSSSSIVKWKLSHLQLKRADWAGGRYSPLLYKNCSITHTTFTIEASTWTSNTLPFFPPMEKKSLFTCDVVNTAYTQPKAFVPSPTTVIAISAELSSELTVQEVQYWLYCTWSPARLLHWAQPPLCGTCLRTAAQLSPEGCQASLKDRQSSNPWKQQIELFLFLSAGGFWPSVCILIPQMKIFTYIYVHGKKPISSHNRICIQAFQQHLLYIKFKKVHQLISPTDLQLPDTQHPAFIFHPRMVQQTCLEPNPEVWWRRDLGKVYSGQYINRSISKECVCSSAEVESWLHL